MDIAKPNDIGYNTSMRYSMDFRKKVMEVKARQGLSVRETAERFGIHFNTIQRWSTRLEAKPCGPAKGSTTKLDLAELKAYYTANNGAYQSEAAAHFKVGRATIWRALRRLKWSHQKNVATSQSMYT